MFIKFENRKFLKVLSKEFLYENHDYVYTLGIEKDHSYNVEGIICENCFLLGTNDSLTDICKLWNSCAQISKWSGGIGIHLSNIRAKDSIIRGTCGKSNGLIPLLKIFNDIVRWVDQGGKRPGSIAVYLEPHHPDIFEFLDLRKNFGSENDRARDLFLALWISDLFMKQVENDNNWYLFSSDECPRLNDTFGEEFEKLYWKYVDEKKFRKEIPARKLWMAILEAQIETGMPYMLYKDSINKKNNQKNLGIIRSSNLCVHGMTNILTDQGYYPIDTLKNKEVKIWNGDEWSLVTIRQTGSNKNLIRINLSNGTYLDCTPEHVFYTQINNQQNKVQASDLKINDILINFNLPPPIEFTYSNKLYAYNVPRIISIDDRIRWLEYYCNTNDYQQEEQSIKINSSNKEFLLKFRLMLHTLSIESKVIINNNFNNKIIYSLIIESYNLYKLYKLGFRPRKLIISNKESNKYDIPLITVVSIEESYKNVDTYCFTEPLKNKGIFNGILCGNCAEIVEYSDNDQYAVCNLASISLKSFISQFTINSEDNWIIYTKPRCKFCIYAKSYLKNINIKFTEISYSDEIHNNLKLSINKNIITYPQIFINDIHIGGWHELFNYIKGEFNFDKLYDVAYLATLNLDKVIDVNYYPVKEAKLSNIKHRPIGIGIQGLADSLALLKIPFDSEESLKFNSKVMETIYLAAITASNDIAKDRACKVKELKDYLEIRKEIIIPEYYESSIELPDNKMNLLYHELRITFNEIVRNCNESLLGSYYSFEGSFFSEGKFQFDLWDIKHELYYKDKWDKLRADIIKYGTRNSMLTALMPTASTSQLLGNNECFEFFTNNIYTRRTHAGDFLLVNKYLVNELINIGVWSDELKDKIIANNGSLQLLDIPIEIKNIYKTIWEIGQVWVLNNSIARAPFVDQSQSLNIFMAKPDYQRLTSSHFYGWKNGLKTGMYYLRSRPSVDPIKFTIDPKLIKENETCEMCSG
jgi:ribonucleotide reductase alpha subunit